MGWASAVQLVAEEPEFLIQGTKFPRADRKSLLSELREIKKKLQGRILMYRDYRKLGGTYSIGTFQRYFGSWKNATEAVDLINGHSSRPRPELRHYTDADYFTELDRVWRIVGRQPFSTEMRRLGRISPQAFYTRFGGWPKAVQAFKNRRCSGQITLVLPNEVAAGPTYAEGSIQQILVNRYERDPEARQRCIEHYGTRCVLCGFDFGAKYGANMAGFIHVHHLKPLAQAGEEYQIEPVRDLRPVCPNCHAVLHWQTTRSLDEVRELIQDTRGRRTSKRTVP